MSFQLSNIPFIKVDRKILDELSKWPKDRNPYIFIQRHDVYFVSTSSLTWDEYRHDKFTDNYTPRVKCSTLSLCNDNITKKDKRSTPDRFCYGSYYESKDLLLVEDLFKWAHDSRIKATDVRSAWDIIKKSKPKVDKVKKWAKKDAQALIDGLSGR